MQEQLLWELEESRKRLEEEMKKQKKEEGERKKHECQLAKQAKAAAVIKAALDRKFAKETDKIARKLAREAAAKERKLAKEAAALKLQEEKAALAAAQRINAENARIEQELLATIAAEEKARIEEEKNRKREEDKASLAKEKNRKIELRARRQAEMAAIRKERAAAKEKLRQRQEAALLAASEMDVEPLETPSDKRSRVNREDEDKKLPPQLKLPPSPPAKPSSLALAVSREAAIVLDAVKDERTSEFSLPLEGQHTWMSDMVESSGTAAAAAPAPDGWSFGIDSEVISFEKEINSDIEIDYSHDN